MLRLPRLAIAVLPGLDHFIPDLVPALAATGTLSVQVFPVRRADDLAAVLAWTDQPDSDAVWFEFCWPPFPALIASTDFAGRRVVVRIHRIEAYGTDHVANTDWSRVGDVVVVGEDMAARVRAAAPELGMLARLHVIHNGVDLDRFVPAGRSDPYRIGWCGWMSLHKNPTLALEILHRLRREDSRYRLHLSSKGGEKVAVDAFAYLARRLQLESAIALDGAIGHDAIPAWHAANGVLLSTSVYESFGYAIAEAAACGCDLAILDNTAAGEFWPEQTRFATVDEAVTLIRQASPHRWLGLVEQRHDVRLQANRIAAMLAGRTVAEPLPPLQPAALPAPFDSARYWEQRYSRGGNSGAGSHGRLARFKADTLNALAAEFGIDSVAEFGCGDGDQLALAHYPDYIGIDVSASAVQRCRARFAADPDKRFLLLQEAQTVQVDMALSLDVIFHLVEDEAYEQYMRRLFAAARKLVVIYASDHDASSADRHVRHRAFSAWIAAHAPGWQRVRRVPNPYPYQEDRPHDTSFAEFQVFAAPAAPAA